MKCGLVLLRSDTFVVRRARDALQVRALLERNSEELDSFVKALNGEYVLPEAGGDLLRDGPGVLPTGAALLLRFCALKNREIKKTRPTCSCCACVDDAAGAAMPLLCACAFVPCLWCCVDCTPGAVAQVTSCCFRAAPLLNSFYNEGISSETSDVLLLQGSPASEKQGAAARTDACGIRNTHTHGLSIRSASSVSASSVSTSRIAAQRSAGMCCFARPRGRASVSSRYNAPVTSLAQKP